MEKLVREELERWDSDASLREGGTRPPSASSRMSAASSKKRPPKSANSRASPRGSATSVRINAVSIFTYDYPSRVKCSELRPQGSSHSFA